LQHGDPADLGAKIAAPGAYRMGNSFAVAMHETRHLLGAGS
jgi:hypothetical protein